MRGRPAGRTPRSGRGNEGSSPSPAVLDRLAPVSVLLDASGRPFNAQHEIIVPAHLADENVRIGVCTVCSAKRARDGLPPLKFHRGEEEKWQTHVGRCARANMDELRAQSPIERNKGTIFDPNASHRDPELERHFRRVGERMRRERRWDVRPSERGGF